MGLASLALDASLFFSITDYTDWTDGLAVACLFSHEFIEFQRINLCKFLKSSRKNVSFVSLFSSSITFPAVFAGFAPWRTSLGLWQQSFDDGGMSDGELALRQACPYRQQAHSAWLVLARNTLARLAYLRSGSTVVSYPPCVSPYA